MKLGVFCRGLIDRLRGFIFSRDDMVGECPPVGGVYRTIRHLRQFITSHAILLLLCVAGVGCVYAKAKTKTKKSKTPTQAITAVEDDEAVNDASSRAGKQDAASETQTPVDSEVPKDVVAWLKSNNGASYKREIIEGDPAEFNEVWAFYTSFYRPNENRLNTSAQVTDIALFGAEIGSYGDLQEIPSPTRATAARTDFAGRVHMTFACSSRGVTHFCLNPKYDLRAPLLNAIAAASKGYDGVVCDLESIGARDREDFLSFLKDLKSKLGYRMLTVCVPARTKTLANDIFDYRAISEIADRVFVMAYDEHWSTSAPGPVASYAWCDRVASYAADAVPHEKLIMGIPFYARAWVDKTKNPVGAWRYPKFNKHLAENGVTSIERTADGDGHVRYSATLTVDAYFDDAYSLYKKCMMYQAKNITGMGVWCIGQDDPEFWKWVKVTPTSSEQ